MLGTSNVTQSLVNSEDCGASLSKQRRSSIVWPQSVTSYITKLQYTGHACLQLAGVKSGHLLTSIGSKHAATNSQFAFHCPYINSGIFPAASLWHWHSFIGAISSEPHTSGLNL